MEWLKKRGDTLIIIGLMLGTLVWMNAKFNAIEKDLAIIKNDVAIIKTVMIINHHMPYEFVN